MVVVYVIVYICGLLYVYVKGIGNVVIWFLFYKFYEKRFLNIVYLLSNSKI